MGGKVVAYEWLATVFVYSLEDFIASCIAETGEERCEFGSDGGGGVVFEDDRVEGGG